MTQSREQFEAHYDGWCSSGFQGYTESMRMGNSYKLPSIASAWAHWQASRDALVIVLPICFAYPVSESASEADYYFDQGQADGLSKARAAIHTEGIKTNPPT